jgi:PAS domain S-box-containing protein
VIAIVERDREQGFEVEYRVIRPDGSMRWIRDRGFPIQDESGHVYRVAGIAEDITERKQAEDALRGSEDRIRLIIDTIPMMAWSLGPDGVLDYVNQRWLDYTGLSLEKAIEEPTRTVHPEDLSRALEKWLVVKATSEAYEAEMRLQRADGEYRWFLIRIAPLLDEQGNVLKRYGASIDIEDRKRVEEALKESQRKLEEAQRIAHVGHWDRDLETGRITWSDEMYRILGLPLEERDSSRTEWLDIVHPEDRQRVSLAIEEMQRGIRRFDVEFRIVRPNGEVRFIHSQGDVICDERGRPLRRFGTAQDITERKQAEDALRRSEDRLRLVIDTIPTMAWSLQPNGAIDFVNQRWMDYTGLSFEEAIAEPTRTMHPEDLSGAMAKWAANMADGEPFEGEMRLRQADGEYRWFLVRTDPLRDEQGNLVKWYGASIDIEDRKQAEQKLTATSEQLRALSARLQSAREAEGTRIAREIHDELGSALTSLKWDLEGMEKSLSDPKRGRDFESMKKKAETMTRLVDSTIDVVRRISAELRPSVLDDLGLVPAIEWQAQQFQDRTGIAVHCDCLLDDVDLDHEQSTAVFRIFQESLTNVLRHSRATRVDVTMVEKDDAFVLTIRDNGRGITEGEKFAQSSIGLLGMRERAHLIGGEIEITGIEGKGTTVTVRLPL